MKAIGIVLLSLGILSLIGGIIHPSEAIVEVVIFGYFLKFVLVIIGVALISLGNKHKAKDSLLIIRDKTLAPENQDNLVILRRRWSEFVIPGSQEELEIKSDDRDDYLVSPLTNSNIDNSILLERGKTLLLDPKLKSFKSATFAEQVGIANKWITDIINVDPNNRLYDDINPNGSPKPILKIKFREVAKQFLKYVGDENLKLHYESLKASYMIASNCKIIKPTGTKLIYNTKRYIDKIDYQSIIDEYYLIKLPRTTSTNKNIETNKKNKKPESINHKSSRYKVHNKSIEMELNNYDKEPSLNNILRVNYYPDNIFEQSDPWEYPLVKFPKHNCIIRSFKIGAKNRKGYKDPIFQASIEKIFGQMFSITGNIRLNTGTNTRPYEPDIAIIDYKSELNIRIDVEIDEPYSGISRQVTHCIGEDERRDSYFVERGWIVLRFTEFQVHTKEIECIAYIAHVLKSIDPSYKIPKEFSNINKIDFEEQWDIIQAQKWERQNYREEYLDHVFSDSYESEEFLDRALSSQEKKEETFVESDFNLKVENRVDSGFNKINRHSRDKRIKFYPESHHYEIDGIGAFSASNVISKFFPDFDVDYAISIMSESHELYGTPQTDIKNLWKAKGNKSRDEGTLLHDQIERYFLNEEICSTKEFTHFLNFKNDHQLLKPYRTEWRIFDDNYQIGGTIDLITHQGNKYDLYDWKRSSKVIDHYNTPITENQFQKGIGKLQHLADTSFNRYSLQQSLYRYILEANYDIRISNMFLVILHPKYDNYFKVPVPYLRNEIDIILKSI